MEFSVVNTSGKEQKKVAANPALFEAEVKESVIHSVVRWQRAKQRAGTHATLNLAKMEGGGKKPFKQKGLGRARAGTRNSPLWVGGAVIFGPQPRDYSHKLPRKIRKQAIAGVLSDKAKNGAISVVDQFSIEAPKTKEFVSILESIGVFSADKSEKKPKVVLVFSDGEEAVAVSARNIKTVKCLPEQGVNVYDILHADRVVLSEKTLEALQSRLSAPVARESESEE